VVTGAHTVISDDDHPIPSRWSSAASPRSGGVACR